MSSKLTRISVFDFDGTLIAGDSLPMFIKHSRGAIMYYVGLLILSPILVCYILKLISNNVAKERLFRFYFRGMKEVEFVQNCRNFASVLDKRVNSRALQELKNAQASGQRVIILSASPRLWIEPWAQQYGVEVIGTELQVQSGIITGSFETKNCYGAEKVNRLIEYLSCNREDVYIIAYGDSKGDIPIMNYAEEAYWVKNTTIVRYER